MIEMPLWHQKTASSFRKVTSPAPAPLPQLLTLHLTLPAGYYRRVSGLAPSPFPLSFLMGVKLPCSVVLFSAVQWSEPAICVHVFPPSWTSLETILPCWVIPEQQAIPVLCGCFPPSSVQLLSRVWLFGLQYARLPCPSATRFLLASYFIHGCVFMSNPISGFIPTSWDLSSPIRDGACAPCIGSAESLPLGLHQSFPF